MATKKEPTTVARKVSGKVVNPRNIEWPYDQYGFTTLLRKEGVRAIGRIKGDADKLGVFEDTLRALMEHAEAKIKDQQKDLSQITAAAENRAKAEEARARIDQEREVKRLEAVAASARANFEAQKGNTGDAEDA